METVQLQLDKKGDGLFFIAEGEQQLARMEIKVTDTTLTVFHTEVLPEAEGKGLAKRLLGAMVDYARNHSLKVVPLCPYVHAQFLRHEEMYADLWKRVK